MALVASSFLIFFLLQFGNLNGQISLDKSVDDFDITNALVIIIDKFLSTEIQKDRPINVVSDGKYSQVAEAKFLADLQVLFIVINLN